MSLSIAASLKSEIMSRQSALTLEKNKLVNDESTLAEISSKLASGQPLTFAGSTFTGNSELAYLDTSMQQGCYNYAAMNAPSYTSAQLGLASQRGEIPAEQCQQINTLAFKKAWTEFFEKYCKPILAQVEKRIQLSLDEIKRKEGILQQRMEAADKQEQQAIQDFGKRLV